MPQPGLFSFLGARAARPRGRPAHPGAARGADPLEVVAEQAAEAVVDRREQAAGDEDPRLGDRVAVGVERRRRPGRAGSRSAKKSCTSRICAAHRLRDHRVLGGLGQRLDPEVDEPELRALRHVGVDDRAQAARRDPSASASSAISRKLPPGLVEAGEVEVALRAEVAVEDRLGDPRLARDLGRRRAAVARARRRRGRRCRAPPAAARRRASRAASRSAELIRRPRRTSGAGRLVVRLRTWCRVDERDHRADERRSAPQPRARGGSRSRTRAGRGSPAARQLVDARGDDRAHDAIPSEPPTWRTLFSTAEPTPALSGRTDRIAAAVVGAIVSRHADAAEDHRRQERPRRSRAPRARENRRASPRAAIMPAVTIGRASRSGRRACPASGAMRMIRIVHGRNAAPACDRRVAEDLLDVERDVEEDAEHRERRRAASPCSRRRSVRFRKSDRSSIGSRWCSSSRMNATSATAAIANEAEDPRRRPAVVVRLDQPVAEREQADRGGDEAGDVGPLLARGVAATRR